VEFFSFGKEKGYFLEIAAVGAQNCGKPNFYKKSQGKFIPREIVKSGITFHSKKSEKIYPQLPYAQLCG